MASRTDGQNNYAFQIVTAYRSLEIHSQALVIPQNMDGKRLIAIDTELGTHYYTPKEGAAELEAGKVHTYNITIDSKEVTIEIPGSIDWGEGESGSGSIEL